MNKEKFWILTHTRGMSLSDHTRLWNLYCKCSDSDKLLVLQFLRQLPITRAKPYTTTKSQ